MDLLYQGHRIVTFEYESRQPEPTADKMSDIPSCMTKSMPYVSWYTLMYK